MLSSIPSKRNLEPDVEARESMRGGRADKSNDFQGTTSPNILCGRRVDTWVHGFGGTVERVLDTQRRQNDYYRLLLVNPMYPWLPATIGLAFGLVRRRSAFSVFRMTRHL